MMRGVKGYNLVMALYSVSLICPCFHEKASRTHYAMQLGSCNQIGLIDVNRVTSLVMLLQ